MRLPMTRDQWIAVGLTTLLFLVLYFGFDIKPKSQKQLEKTRAVNIEATSIDNLIKEARIKLGAKYGLIEALHLELNALKNDSLKVEKLKQLSGKWYELGFAAIAGYYAEEIARIKEDADSWSMAGTSYLLAIQQSEEVKVRTWSLQRSVKAFESAISMEPQNISHQINLALAYVEMPPSDNPMKGILMLRQLDESFPDNVKILSQLGRLSISTNQLDNALKRLKRAEELDPENKNVICLLALTYEKTGDRELADKYNRKCVN